MSDTALPPGRRLELALSESVTDIAVEIDKQRRLLKVINDPGLAKVCGSLEDVLDLGARIAAARTASSGGNVAQDVAGLLGTLRAVKIPSRDPETGEDSFNLDQLRGAQGRMVMALSDALDAAHAIGLEPSEPALPGGMPAEVPRSGNEDLLRDIAASLDHVAEQLSALEATNTEPSRIVNQAGLIEFYLGAMRVQVDLARLQLTLGERTVDFAALSRASQTMAELTGDFFATITAWAGRVSERVRQAARTVNRAVANTAGGLGRAIGVIVERRKRPPTADPAPLDEVAAADGDFDPAEAARIILEGKLPPTSWWPLITRLDLSGSFGEKREFSNLARLQALNNLQTLNCSGTQVSDLAPLQALNNLQTLNCSRTQVSDLAPLQALNNLQTLDCSFTQVSDLAPLQALNNLQTLNCSFTRVSDLAPLQALNNLQTLYCSDTQVSDLAPLQALNNLQTLYCWDTQVSDLAPLQALNNLQTLDCSRTQVSDLAPLQALNNLQTLDCLDTQVTDFAPLRHLTGLAIHGKPGVVSAMTRRGKGLLTRLLSRQGKT